MAVRGFSVKQPMNSRDRRFALYGWGVGALLALGAYVGAIQFFPAQSNFPMIATLPANVDPITTGSIGTMGTSSFDAMNAPMPSMPFQARLDALTMDVGELRESLAAAHAASISTNRRLETIEENILLVTASINAPVGAGEDQPLPAQVSVEGTARPLPVATAPRIVLPAPNAVDGGAVAVRVRPMDDDITVGASIDPSAMDDMLADGVLEVSATTPARGDAEVGDDEIVAIVGEGTADEMPPEPAQLISQTPFAIDLGGARSLEGVDILWRERTDAYGEVLQGLAPRILLQQTSDGALDLRLVAGPINDAADAALLCAQLVAAGLQRCLPAVYDGQQLALR